MHDEATHFLKYVASVSKPHFTRGKVALDVGSYDYNGSNRPLFDSSCIVHGNDVFPGHNVDLVYKTADLPFFEPTFDTIVSSNCFQHDLEYKESLRKLLQILRPGGILAFTCATAGKPEHGTRRHKPEMSLAARVGLSKWKEYYRPLTLDDILSSLNLAEFQTYAVFENASSKDIFFVGLKKDPKRPTFTLDFSAYPNATSVAVFPAPPAIQNSSIEEVLTYDQLTATEKAIVDKYLNSKQQE
jgi:SAM-dependent methyltransferase